jgi:hypothetical protein
VRNSAYPQVGGLCHWDAVVQEHRTLYEVLTRTFLFLISSGSRSPKLKIVGGQ